MWTGRAGVYARMQTTGVFAGLYLLSAFVTRRIIPGLRRHFPFLVLRQPILQSAEADSVNLSGPAKVTWFEMTTAVLNRLQAFLFAPVVVLCMISQSADILATRTWSPW